MLTRPDQSRVFYCVQRCPLLDCGRAIHLLPDVLCAFTLAPLYRVYQTISKALGYGYFRFRQVAARLGAISTTRDLGHRRKHLWDSVHDFYSFFQLLASRKADNCQVHELQRCRTCCCHAFRCLVLYEMGAPNVQGAGGRSLNLTISHEYFHFL